MSKLATITFYFLALLQPNNLTPQLADPNLQAKSDTTVIKYIEGGFNLNTPFPNRDKEAEVAKQIDVQREQARLAEIERVRAAQAAKAVVVAAPVQTMPTVAQNTPVDGNSAKMFIYNKESGNRTTARNGAGCLGLGQACPGSKLLAVCPDLNDYACQDAFFTNYAISRYGSWEKAYNFWLLHKWW